MTDTYRKDRILRLFEELKYEITRGVMEHAISERLKFTFTVPVSAEGKDFAVAFTADLRPMPRWSVRNADETGRLRIIEGDKV